MVGIRFGCLLFEVGGLFWFEGLEVEDSGGHGSGKLYFMIATVFLHIPQWGETRVIEEENRILNRGSISRGVHERVQCSSATSVLGNYSITNQYQPTSL